MNPLFTRVMTLMAVLLVSVAQAEPQSSSSSLGYSLKDVKRNTAPGAHRDAFDQLTMALLIKDSAARENVSNLYYQEYRQNNIPVLRNRTALYLVSILSDYFDEGTKTWRTIQGLGVVVHLPVQGHERAAILSVSHVTQGGNIRVFDAQGKSVSVENEQRLASVDRDVELILLKDLILSPLFWQDGVFKSVSYDLKTGEAGEAYQSLDHDRIYVATKQFVPIFQSLLPKKSKGQSNQSFELNRQTMIAQAVFKDFTTWVDLLAYLWDHDGVLPKQLSGSGYISNSRMLPGLSGGPLIQDLPSSEKLMQGIYEFRLSGLVQGHHLYEDKSFFASDMDIQFLVKQFLAGKRGRTSGTHWRVKNGVTFRDYGNGVLEAAFVKTPSSSFLKGDSGNAISVDGYVSPFVMGMQSGDSTTVGNFVQTKDSVVPVLAEPHLNVSLPTEMTVGKSFGAKQDLWELAKAKNKKLSKVMDAGKTDCTYNVNEQGIHLQIQTVDGSSIVWSRSRQQLSKGFKDNSLVIHNDSGVSVELSGLFLSDLSSMVNNTGSALVPTVSVIKSPTAAGERVICYSSKEEKDELRNKSYQELRDKINELAKTLR